MNKSKKGLLLVLTTALISGVSIFLNGFGVKGFDSSVFTFSKNLLVGVFLLAVIMGVGQFSSLKELSKKQWLQLVGIGFIGGSIPFLMFFKGLQLTTGTTSAFIHKTLFIYASIFALIFLKEKLTKWVLIGAGMLLVGTYLMLKPDFSFSIGHLLIIGATIFWAVENVLSKHVLKEVKGNVVAFGRMFFGAGFIFAFLLFTGKAPTIISMSLEQYLWILVTTVFLMGYVMTYYNGLKHVKVSTATSVLALGAPITTLLGVLFKGSAVSVYQVLGMVLVVAGVMSITILSYLSSSVVKSRDVVKDEWN